MEFLKTMLCGKQSPKVQWPKNTIIRWAATPQTCKTPNFDAIAFVWHDYMETQTITNVPWLTLEYLSSATLQILGFGFYSALIVVNKTENSESCMGSQEHMAMKISL